MKHVTLPLPEVAAITATRALGAAGVALILAGLVSPERRRSLGLFMLGVGIGSSFPLALDVIRRNPSLVCEDEE